ncbi:MAG TPA: SurA N-terminal domain-containing protein, partial [Armatimonadota bacterium]|nr:SurA N-terminal domain-containing protein [Armatimonadota bacterium]
MPSFIRFQKSAGSRRASKIILAIIAAIFGVGAFFSFGGSPGRNPMGSIPDAFRVNGKTINMAEFHQALENYENQMQMYGGSKGDPTRERAMQLAVMKELIVDTALQQDAARRKLSASSEDIEKARLEWIQQQTASLGEGAAKQKALIEENMTEAEFNERIQQRARSLGMQQYFTHKIVMEKL